MTERFTDLMIRNLKPRLMRYDVRESGGFGIRVFPSGEKSWIYLYTHHGRKRRMTLGKYPALSLKEARGAHAEAVHVLAQGSDPADRLRARKAASAVAAATERQEPTVEALAREYLTLWARAHKRSWREDQRMLEKDIVPAWGKRKAKDITRRDVVLVLDTIRARGAPIQANRVLAVVRRMFNFSVERGILPASPVSHVKPVAKEARRDRVLAPDEIRAVWDGLDAAPMTEPIRLALRLILITGQRKGEVVAMEWAEVDAGWWTIPATKSKNGEPHRVPLSAMALAVLERARAIGLSDRWVFASTRSTNPITGSAVDHALRRCAFGVAHFTPHDLRRTVATALGELGFHRLIQDKILNHKDNTVGAIYDRHGYDKEKRQALDAWARRLRRLLAGTGQVVPLRVESV